MAFFFNEDTPVRKKIFTVVKFLFFLGLGLLIIWLSLKNLTSEERREILHSFRIANYNWVILAIVLGIFSHILRSLRWMIFLEPMGYRPSVKNTFYAVMIGYFANLAFPRLGEVTRCGILARYEKIPFQKSFGTVITERAIDMLMFFLLFAVMILTQIGTINSYLQTKVYPKLYDKFSDPGANRLFIFGFIVFLVVLFLAFYFLRKKIAHTNFYRQVKTIILGFWEGLKSLGLIRKPVWFVVYTFAIWGLYFLMLYVCFFCFAGTSTLSLGAGLSALVLGSIGIMITPGGIGLYPAIIQETLLLYGVVNTTGLALGWIAWTAQTAMILAVGGLALLLLTFNKKPDENP